MALTKNQKNELAEKVQAIHEEHSGIQSRTDRRNTLLYSVLALLYLALMVFDLTQKDYAMALMWVIVLLWVVNVWIQSRLISFQDFLIKVQRDLRDLEMDEIKVILKEKK